MTYRYRQGKLNRSQTILARFETQKWQIINGEKREIRPITNLAVPALCIPQPQINDRANRKKQGFEPSQSKITQNRRRHLTNLGDVGGSRKYGESVGSLIKTALEHLDNTAASPILHALFHPLFPFKLPGRKFMGFPKTRIWCVASPPWPFHLARPVSSD